MRIRIRVIEERLSFSCSFFTQPGRLWDADQAGKEKEIRTEKDEETRVERTHI